LVVFRLRLLLERLVLRVPELVREVAAVHLLPS
jgi:hypothetical protein